MKAKYGFTKDGQPLNTQRDVVLAYLKEEPGRTITAWQAIKEFGFTRLSGIVKQLDKKCGIVLHRRDIEVETRYGTKVWVTEYWYEEAE